MTEFVEREEIIAKETGDLRQLSVPGECPFRTLRGDLVIVREQLCSLQTFLSQSLGPKPTLSIAPAALRTGIHGYRWLHKYPHRLTTVFHSVLEPKKMKQRKKNICFFKQYPGNSSTGPFNCREQLRIFQSEGSQGFTWQKDRRRGLEPQSKAPTRADSLGSLTQQTTHRGH